MVDDLSATKCAPNDQATRSTRHARPFSCKLFSTVTQFGRIPLKQYISTAKLNNNIFKSVLKKAQAPALGPPDGAAFSWWAQGPLLNSSALVSDERPGSPASGIAPTQIASPSPASDPHCSPLLLSPRPPSLPSPRLRARAQVFYKVRTARRHAAIPPLARFPSAPPRSLTRSMLLCYLVLMDLGFLREPASRRWRTKAGTTRAEAEG
jgi:hypothetical protein